MLAADAPSVTDWMQGWGSLLGVLMSSVAVIFTGWLLRHEIRVRREEKADSDAAQARLIVGQISNWDGDEPNAKMSGPITRLQWELKNYSGAPIFDLRVTVADRWDSHTYGAAIESEDREWITCHPPIRCDPGTVFDPREVEVQIEFTDASGLRWARSVGESPKRVIFHPAEYNGLKRWLPFMRRESPGLDDNPPF
ncbi:hypothetical protein [Actinoplanes auranticolor]|uniref:Uncharacterized protein n=1 Tax=Actinoplanes auranticolor TaxID=47988 RepID=A0A919VWX7_9ACTN|nr:hypothetical protein [Actinoplanes auranticolor]GIM78025.1 hypothetical protein Aau02nite_78870 [Actinoplanes auranticolor]